MYRIQPRTSPSNCIFLVGGQLLPHSTTGKVRGPPRTLLSRTSKTVMSSSAPSTVPPLSHILETCLYVRDVGASSQFYKTTLNIEPFLKTPRVSGFSLGSTTLLLFQLGSTAEDSPTPTGVIPGHGPSDSIVASILSSKDRDDIDDSHGVQLKQHYCLAVKDPEDVIHWDSHLRKKGIRILGRMNWPRGGKSVYFEDPDGHVGEIGSRGIWAHYDLQKQEQNGEG